MVGAAGAALIGGGCGSPPKYYKVVTMDPQGKLASSWTAKGHVLRWDGAYHFKAVERQIDKPQRWYLYPLPHKVRVAAANTVIYRTEEPSWLRGIDPLAVADAAEDGRPLGGGRSRVER